MNPVRVIIRGYRDRPAALFAVEVRGEVVDAFGTNPNDPIPFHLSRAFEFDGLLYEKLESAFTSRRADALARLWENATPFLRR